MQVHLPSTAEAQLPALPPDLWGHLSDMDPRSHQFGRDLAALNELAVETGHAALSHADIFAQESLLPPPGFTHESFMPNGVSLSTGQFADKILSLSQSAGAEIGVGLYRLTTDMGRGVAYCDLRDFMTNSVRRGGPSETGQRDALDRAFLRDVKFFADVGHAKRTVNPATRGVNYSAVGGTKLRTYWTLVNPETPLGVPLIGRLADCGDSLSAEAVLYRQVFGRKL